MMKRLFSALYARRRRPHERLGPATLIHMSPARLADLGIDLVDLESLGDAPPLPRPKSTAI